MKKLSDKNISLVLILIYLVSAVVWHFSTNAPWDDDCVERYFNTLRAPENPANFISVWNRPLFILLFFIPFQVSKHTILLMALISAFSAYLLSRAVKKEGYKSSYMVIIFLLFQTFFFTISRSSLGEPLAAALIAIGYYLYREKKFLLFAVTGSLIPLARLEMSVLLIFWVIVLLQNGHWKYLLIFAIPPLLWNFAGTFLEGDLLWLYENTLGVKHEGNRYGRTDFSHYFQRFSYTVGPIIFYFFFIGILELAYNRSKNLLLLPQFILGFMLYVVFSWKLNLGQAAGFLRHLGSIAPLSALIAFNGYRYWFAAIVNTKEEVAEVVKEIDVESVEHTPIDEKKRELLELEEKLENGSVKKRAYRHQLNLIEKKYEADIDVRNEKAPEIIKTKKNNINPRLRLVIYSIVAIVLSYYYFSYDLRSHHFLKEQFTDFTHLYVISALLGLSIILTLFSKKLIANSNFRFALNLFLVASMVSYTMATESPSSHESAERNSMTEVSNVYLATGLDRFPTIVNHKWFFWSVDRDKSEYEVLKKENLENLKDSTIVIWENHYGTRLMGDVESSYFTGKPEFFELLNVTAVRSKFNVRIFQKIKAGDAKKPELVMPIINRFVQKADLPQAYVRRADLKNKLLSDIEGATNDLNTAVDYDLEDQRTRFSRGNHFYKTKQFALAREDFSKIIELLPEDYSGYLNVGLCYYNEDNYDKAIEFYKQAEKVKPKNYKVQLELAKAYNAKSDYKNSIAAFSKAIEIKPEIGNNYYNRGLLNLKSNKLEQGCNDLNKALELGFTKAQSLIDQYCKGTS